MRVSLSWAFVAPAALVSPMAAAEIYMTAEQAQALMFPGATFTESFHQITDAQAKAIEEDADVNVRDRTLKAWKASTGGWFILDEVIGKHEFIPIALAIDASGAVQDVEILEYRESYGGQVREPAWRAQFHGKTHADAVALSHGVQNISGATLSSKHISDGVRRLLATYAIVLAPGDH